MVRWGNPCASPQGFAAASASRPEFAAAIAILFCPDPIDGCADATAATTNAYERAAEAAGFAFRAAGAAALFRKGRLQRCFRDIYVGAAHQVFDERNFIELAKPGLGLEPSPF